METGAGEYRGSLRFGWCSGQQLVQWAAPLQPRDTLIHAHRAPLDPRPACSPPPHLHPGAAHGPYVALSGSAMDAFPLRPCSCLSGRGLWDEAGQPPGHSTNLAFSPMAFHFQGESGKMTSSTSSLLFPVCRWEPNTGNSGV